MKATARRTLAAAGLALVVLVGGKMAFGGTPSALPNPDPCKGDTNCRLTRLETTVYGDGSTPTPSVTPSSTESVTPSESPSVTPSSTSDKLIGMSAPASDWAQRIQEVGPGVKARRIFADLSQGGDDQANLIKQAFNDGMVPVISYKVGGDYAGAKSGKYDAAAKQAAAMISAYNKPATVTLLHEPQGDLSGADFVAIQNRMLPIFETGQIKFGPLLNGWLLDNKESTFTSFTTPTLLSQWDFVGIDTYDSGTASNPGSTRSADRIPELVAWLKAHGQPNKRIVIGEYNGYTASSIKATGDAVLSTPQVWIACVWNSVGGKGYVLTGDRLDAFKQTLAEANQ